MLSRRALITGALAMLLAPWDLTEPRRKVWALGGFDGPWRIKIGDESLRVLGFDGRTVTFERATRVAAAGELVWIFS